MSCGGMTRGTGGRDAGLQDDDGEDDDYDDGG